MSVMMNHILAQQQAAGALKIKAEAKRRAKWKGVKEVEEKKKGVISE